MSCRDEIKARLARLGFDRDIASAALELDATMQRWRRRAMRRDLERRAIADLGLDLDVARLDVLLAIWAPENEFDAAAGETTVGAIAQRLSLDPSRASRMVSEMIAAGYARRAVSQNDARRTVVELTEMGSAVVLAVRSYKVLVLGEFLADWTPEETAVFVPLLERFSVWSDRDARAASERFEREVAALTEDLAATGLPLQKDPG